MWLWHCLLSVRVSGHSRTNFFLGFASSHIAAATGKNTCSVGATQSRVLNVMLILQHASICQHSMCLLTHSLLPSNTLQYLTLVLMQRASSLLASFPPQRPNCQVATLLCRLSRRRALTTVEPHPTVHRTMQQKKTYKMVSWTQTAYDAVSRSTE